MAKRRRTTKARKKDMDYRNHFHATGRVAGSFETASGTVVTIVTKSGRDAFIHVYLPEKKSFKNNDRVEAEGFVSRRTGHDRKGKEYHTQCFIAEYIKPEQTSVQKEFGTDKKGLYYDEPHFEYEIAGDVLHTDDRDGFTSVLIRTRRPDGSSIGVWLSMKTPGRGFPVKAGDAAAMTAGVYTGNRKHETITIKDVLKTEKGSGNEKDEGVSENADTVSAERTDEKPSKRAMVM